MSQAGVPAVRRADLALILLVTLAWGLNYPVMKSVVSGYPPLTFRSFTFLLALCRSFPSCESPRVSLLGIERAEAKTDHGQETRASREARAPKARRLHALTLIPHANLVR